MALRAAGREGLLSCSASPARTHFGNQQQAPQPRSRALAERISSKGTACGRRLPRTHDGRSSAQQRGCASSRRPALVRQARTRTQLAANPPSLVACGDSGPLPAQVSPDGSQACLGPHSGDSQPALLVNPHRITSLLARGATKARTVQHWAGHNRSKAQDASWHRKKMKAHQSHQQERCTQGCSQQGLAAHLTRARVTWRRSWTRSPAARPCVPAQR